MKKKKKKKKQLTLKGKFNKKSHSSLYNNEFILIVLKITYSRLGSWGLYQILRWGWVSSQAYGMVSSALRSEYNYLLSDCHFSWLNNMDWYIADKWYLK